MGDPLDTVRELIEAPDGYAATYLGDCDTAPQADGICSSLRGQTEDLAVFLVGQPASDFIDYLLLEPTEGGEWEVTDAWWGPGAGPPPEWLRPYVSE